MDNKRENYIGKAYGFFSCSAPKEAIEAKLPMVRKDTKTPGELELSLAEGMDSLRESRGDIGLAQIAREAEKAGMRYVMQAAYPGATNEKTSEEVQALLINLSNSLFCRTDEHIDGKIVYKDKGRYIFRD